MAAAPAVTAALVHEATPRQLTRLLALPDVAGVHVFSAPLDVRAP